MQIDTSPEKYIEKKRKTTGILKNKLFDIIAVFTVLVMSLLSLGALELREITWETILDIIIENVPFYFAATMLSRTYYTKGAYLGKEQDVFINAVKYYSEQVSKLDGKALSILPKFCLEYNTRTLKNMQESILHSAALTMEQYHEYDEKAGAPLKIVPIEEVEKLYGREVAKAVKKCKKCKIKGLTPNILLSNIDSEDSTNLGYNEKELANKRTLSYALSYGVSIVLMSFIGVKSFLEWGWMGLFLTLFKLAFVIFCAGMRYYEGYEDITIHIVDHLFRKSDVLKEFDYWRFPSNYEVKSENEEVSMKE